LIHATVLGRHLYSLSLDSILGLEEMHRQDSLEVILGEEVEQHSQVDTLTTSI
jgi:hypothetical protein